MKKTINYLGIFLVSLALAACSKESAAPSEPKEPETPVVEGNFSLTVATDVISRTELGSDRYIYWKSGDALSVWEAGNASNANVKLDLAAASAGQKRGTFTGSLTPAGDEFRLYAVYPYSSAYASDPSAVALSLPTAVNQVSDVNGLVGVSDFMVGSGSFSSSDTEYLMNFRYPLTLLDIVVDGSGSCLSGAIAQSVTITANTAFVGDATMDLTTGTLTPASADAGKSLVVNFPNTANMSTAQHAWVAIYPVDLTAANCCFDLKMTNGQEIKFNVNPKKAFEEQKIYTINLTNIDAHVDAGQANPVYFDLVGANSGARANCYIVSEGGYYRFTAQRVDKTNVFTGTAPYTDGYRADWLWSEGTTTLVDGVGVGNSGNINFRVKAGARGNALIGLFDSSSKIVWSWHIWMTEADALEPTHWSRNDAWSMANRNLGALSSEEGNVDSYGLYYEWGRKDPFPASSTLGQNSASKETTSFNTSTKPYVFNTNHSLSFSIARNTVAGATDEIAYSIEHPTTFIYYNANNSTNGLANTWFYKTAVADAQALWNNTGNKNKKTNYDPCPPGWSIPINNSYVWQWGEWSLVTPETNSNLSGFNYYKDAGNSSYYPATGYRSAGQLVNVGYVAYYWTSVTDVNTNFTGKGIQYENRGSRKNNNASLRSDYGLPVRCMKI